MRSDARKRAATSEPSADVEALDSLVRLLVRHVLSHLTPEHCTADCMARAILASDALAAHTAAAEARGAQAVLDAVEGDAGRCRAWPDILAAAREAARNAGGGR